MVLNLNGWDFQFVDGNLRVWGSLWVFRFQVVEFCQNSHNSSQELLSRDLCDVPRILNCGNSPVIISTIMSHSTSCLFCQKVNTKIAGKCVIFSKLNIQLMGFDPAPLCPRYHCFETRIWTYWKIFEGHHKVWFSPTYHWQKLHVFFMAFIHVSLATSQWFKVYT